MADVEIVFTSGWEQWLDSRINHTVMSVGSDVKDDAVRICPVDTGALRESLTLINFRPKVARIISDRPYCAAVELGFHGEETVRAHMRLNRPVREFVRHGNTPAQPFLRPSLYRKRSLAVS